MPEPDLPPLVISDEMVNVTRAALPELPRQSAISLVNRYGLEFSEVWLLLNEPGAVDYFEECSPPFVMNFVSR